MNKDGFTLMEIIIVVAILAILAVIATPAVIKIYNNTKINIVKEQERDIEDAARVFNEDFCHNPISNLYSNYCKPDLDKSVLRKNNDTYYICTNDLVELNYIDHFNFSGNNCSGFVIFNEDENNYEIDKTYLKCGDAYLTYEDVCENDASLCQKYNSILDSCNISKAEDALNCIEDRDC